MMIKRFSLVLLLLTTACQTHRITYAETLDPWLGQAEERLMQAWGHPYNTFFIMPNEKVVSYIKFASHPMGGYDEPYTYEVAYDAIETPDYGDEQPSTDYYCQTSFTIRDDIVIDYSFNGDDCVVLY